MPERPREPRRDDAGLVPWPGLSWERQRRQADARGSRVGFDDHEPVIGAEAPGAGRGVSTVQAHSSEPRPPARVRSLAAGRTLRPFAPGSSSRPACHRQTRSRPTRTRAPRRPRRQRLSLTTQQRRQRPERHDRQQDDELKDTARPPDLGVVPGHAGLPAELAQDGTGTFSRRALPVPAIALRISVSA